MVIEVRINNQRNFTLDHAEHLYRVRFYNETGVEIRFRIIGIFETSNYCADLSIGEKILSEHMGGGRRVLVAWDDITQDVVSVMRLRIERHGRIRIKENIPLDPQFAPTLDGAIAESYMALAEFEPEPEDDL